MSNTTNNNNNNSKHKSLNPRASLSADVIDQMRKLLAQKNSPKTATPNKPTPTTTTTTSNNNSTENLVFQHQSIDVEIRWQQEDAVYSKGSRIMGDVICTPISSSKKPIVVQDISLHIQGYEQVEIVSQNKSEPEQKENNIIYEHTVPLAGAGELVVGEQYDYHFEYDLNDTNLNSLPGSFFDETLYYGQTVRACVQYCCTVTVDYLDENNQEQTVYVYKDFVVTDSLPSKTTKRATASKIKSLDNTNTSKVIIQVDVERDVLFPGSKLKVRTNVRNETPKHIPSLVVTLLRNMTISTKSKVLQIPDEVLRKNCDGIDSMEQDVRNISIDLPEDMPCMTHAKLITVDYQIRIAVALPHNDLDVIIPVQLVPHQRIQFQAATNSTASLLGSTTESMFDNDKYRKSVSLTQAQRQTPWLASCLPCFF